MTHTGDWVHAAGIKNFKIIIYYHYAVLYPVRKIIYPVRFFTENGPDKLPGN